MKSSSSSGNETVTRSLLRAHAPAFSIFMLIVSGKKATEPMTPMNAKKGDLRTLEY